MYLITGQETLCVDLQELKEAKSTPEMEVLGRLILFFWATPGGPFKTYQRQEVGNAPGGTIGNDGECRPKCAIRAMGGE